MILEASVDWRHCCSHPWKTPSARKPQPQLLRGRLWHNGADPFLYLQVTHVFSDIKMGVRFVSFEHWGQDTQFWAGHYGARVTNSSVIVRVRLY